MPKSYIEVRIVADEGLREQLVEILSQLGIEGFWEEDAVLKCYMNAERWTPALLGEIQSTATMIARSSNSSTPKVTVSTIEDQNWNATWKATIKPIQITERIVITPSWHEYQPGPGQIVLTIDPKMSFGTGYHETTRLSLKLIEKHCCAGMAILDVGTGTGVLAIAAVKLGAASALGIDNDEWACRNAIENVHVNGVEDKVKIVMEELQTTPTHSYDMIVANIQRNVIVQLLDDMKTRLAPGGAMLLSGLLTVDEETIIDALHERGFKILEEMIENEWIALAACLR